MLKKILYILCLSMATGYASGILSEPDASQPESWGSTFQKLCTVPKTFVQSLYMTKDEIVLGKVTTAEKVKNGVHDLAQAAKTFDPTPLVDPVGVAAQNVTNVILKGVTSFHNMSTGGKFLVVGTVGLAVLQTVNAATVYAPAHPQHQFTYDPRSPDELCLEQRFSGHDVYGNSIGALCRQTTHYDKPSSLCMHNIRCVAVNSDPDLDRLISTVLPTLPLSPSHLDLDIKEGQFSLHIADDCASLNAVLPAGWQAFPEQLLNVIGCRIYDNNNVPVGGLIPPTVDISDNSIYDFKEVHFVQECSFDQFRFHPYGTCFGVTGPELCNAEMMNKPYGLRIPAKDAENCTLLYSKDPALAVGVRSFGIASSHSDKKIVPYGLQPILAQDGGTQYPSLENHPNWVKVIGRKVNTDEL